MHALEYWLIPGMWAAWAVYWLVSSVRVEKSKRVEAYWQRAIHLGLLDAAFVLLWAPMHFGDLLSRRLLPDSLPVFVAGALLTAAGLLFAVWARVHLGRFWSATVTLKEGHRLIRSGPYALVRHPIYTGFLLGIVGAAVAVGQTRGLIAVALVLAAYLQKIPREERWLGEEFGEEHARYRRTVKALVPFVI